MNATQRTACEVALDTLCRITDEWDPSVTSALLLDEKSGLIEQARRRQLKVETERARNLLVDALRQ